MPQGSVVAMLAERTQLDFELAFFAAILAKAGDYTEVLRAHASNLATKGLLKEGLLVEQKLSQVRPADPTVFYHLACSYASLRQPDLALETLRKAVELGYRDFRAMIHDRHLATVHKDPRFRKLLKEYGEL